MDSFVRDYFAADEQGRAALVRRLEAELSGGDTSTP